MFTVTYYGNSFKNAKALTVNRESTTPLIPSKLWKCNLSASYLFVLLCYKTLFFCKIHILLGLFSFFLFSVTQATISF